MSCAKIELTRAASAGVLTRRNPLVVLLSLELLLNAGNLALLAVIYAAFPIVYIISAALNPGGTLTGSNALFESGTKRLSS